MAQLTAASYTLGGGLIGGRSSMCRDHTPILGHYLVTGGWVPRLGRGSILIAMAVYYPSQGGNARG